MCIATNGSYNQLLSTEELISCSGIKSVSKGCHRGIVQSERVRKYFKTHGLATPVANTTLTM